jgi:hypothetical protein
VSTVAAEAVPVVTINPADETTAAIVIFTMYFLSWLCVDIAGSL